MAELTEADEGAATNFIETTFSVESSLARDYARIAVFLSVEKLWQPAIKEASELLRDQYEAEVVRGHGNRLTTAIGGVAKHLGFDPYSNGVILAGFTSEKTFIEYVQQGAFWKDAVSSNHGEHSHSLQWIALALGLEGRGYKIGHLYRQAVKYKSKTQFLHSGRNELATIYLWDFLVDCFDFGNQDPAWKTNIHTQTARSPTFVNKYVQKNADALWIGSYLLGRHAKREWGSVGQGVQIKDHAIKKAGERNFKQTAQNSGGNYVFERSGISASRKPPLIAGSRMAKLEVTAPPPWGPNKGKFGYWVRWTTKTNEKLCVALVGSPPPDAVGKPGEYTVKVSVVDDGNGKAAAQIVA